MNRLNVLFVFPFATLIACGGTGTDAPAPGDTTTTPPTTGGTTPEDPAAVPGAAPPSVTGERTLATCASTVDPAVPAFYKTYFACSDIAMNGSDVAITTAGLPPHRSNYYGTDSPNYTPFDTTRGAQYHANPNVLTSKTITVTIATNPVPRGITVTPALMTGGGTSQIEYALGPVGVAIDSVYMFNPQAAPGDDIETEKYTFDSYNAHPTGTHLYHYHTTSQGPLEALVSKKLIPNATLGSAEIELFGIMCDGTVVMGCTELDGSAPQTGDIDAQNGHVHDLKDKSGAVMLANRYHTHMCPDRIGTHHFTPKLMFYSACAVK